MHTTTTATTTATLAWAKNGQGTGYWATSATTGRTYHAIRSGRKFFLCDGSVTVTEGYHTLKACKALAEELDAAVEPLEPMELIDTDDVPTGDKATRDVHGNPSVVMLPAGVEVKSAPAASPTRTRDEFEAFLMDVEVPAPPAADEGAEDDPAWDDVYDLTPAGWAVSEEVVTVCGNHGVATATKPLRKRVVKPAVADVHVHQKPIYPCDFKPRGYAGLISINGTQYWFLPLGGDTRDGYRLAKVKDGTVYDVDTSSGHPVCDCPDFTFHDRNGVNNPCKHCLALVQLRKRNVI